MQDNTRFDKHQPKKKKIYEEARIKMKMLGMYLLEAGFFFTISIAAARVLFWKSRNKIDNLC